MATHGGIIFICKRKKKTNSFYFYWWQRCQNPRATQGKHTPGESFCSGGVSRHVLLYTYTQFFYLISLVNERKIRISSLLRFVSAVLSCLPPGWRVLSTSSLCVTLCVFSFLRTFYYFTVVLYGTCCTVKCSNSHIMRSLSHPSRGRVFGVRTSASRDGGDL